MRVIIADDEYLARASLRSMLEELNLPIDFIGEATNGEELTSLVAQTLPEVAFVDIRMPRLNGLESIRNVKAVSPDTRWFILTGFPEFDYAQEAIRLGVSGYLLKPVDPQELNKVLCEFVADHRKLSITQNRQFERELMAHASGLISLELEEGGSVLEKFHFMGAILCLDSPLPEKIKADRQMQFCHRLREQIDLCLKNYNRIALFTLASGELASVGAWSPALDSQAEQQVRDYFHFIEQQSRASSDSDLVITALVSRECAAYPALYEQLDRLQKLAPLRAACGIGRKLELTLLNQQVERAGWLESSQLALNICRCYQERDYLNYMKAVQQLERVLSDASFWRNGSAMKELGNTFYRGMGCQIPAGQIQKPWVRSLQQHGERLLSDMPRDELQTVDMVNQVIAFLDKNYMRDISIGQIADQFNITPNYLSTLFHKKTGTNFMNYLKRTRMLKAKELLSDPNIQVQQVAEKVGYASARHFARLFAEQFDCLPSEYRDRHKTR